MLFLCPSAQTLRFCSDSSTHAWPSPSQDPSGGQYCQLSCTAAYAGNSQFSLFSTWSRQTNLLSRDQHMALTSSHFQRHTARHPSSALIGSSVSFWEVSLAPSRYSLSLRLLQSLIKTYCQDWWNTSAHWLHWQTRLNQGCQGSPRNVLVSILYKNICQ